jgi:hypothetical protein
MPELQQEGALSVGAVGRREHPDGEIIRVGAYARGASRLDERRPGAGCRASRVVEITEADVIGSFRVYRRKLGPPIQDLFHNRKPEETP